MTGLQGFGRLTLAAILAGILVAATAIGWGLLQQRHLEAQSSTSMRSYHQIVHRPQLLACSTQPQQDTQRCVADAKSLAWEHARVEGNLLAQRITALWTQVMGVAAVSGMLLSAIGVALVWSTFRETRRSADAAHDSYQAFIATEDATLALSMYDGSYLNESKTVFSFKLGIFNHGRLAANLAHLEIEAPEFTFKQSVGVSLKGDGRILVPVTVPVDHSESLQVHGAVHYETRLAGSIRVPFMGLLFVTPKGEFTGTMHVTTGEPTPDH